MIGCWRRDGWPWGTEKGRGRIGLPLAWVELRREERRGGATDGGSALKWRGEVAGRNGRENRASVVALHLPAWASSGETRR